MGKPAKKDATLVEAEGLRAEARKAYHSLQRSWFDFAKVVTVIHDSDVWENLGFEDFKGYCKEEFADLDYSRIVRLIRVCKDWGTLIEARLKKNPECQLPSWVTCYQLSISEKKLPEADIPKLKKNVLEGRVTRLEIKERVEATQVIDIEPDQSEDLEEVEVGEVEVEEGVDADSDEVKLDNLTIECIDAAKILRKNLPAIKKLLKEPTQRTVDLAELVYEKLTPTINKFIDHMETISK